MLLLRQEREETIRSFAAGVCGKARPCAYYVTLRLLCPMCLPSSNRDLPLLQLRRYLLCSLRVRENVTPNHTAHASPASKHAAEGARASNHATAAGIPHSRKLVRHSSNGRHIVFHSSIAVVDVADPPTCHSMQVSHRIWSEGEWRKARFLYHSTLQMQVTVTPSACLALGGQAPLPTCRPSVIADTGAQSCPWSMSGFTTVGFFTVDLLPVSVDLTAANKTHIEITEAMVLSLRPSYSAYDRQFCATMVYVSTATHWFYLSCVAMMDLHLDQLVTTHSFFCTRCTLHCGPPAPAININVDSVPVTLDAYGPLLGVRVPAHALLALEFPIAQPCFPSTSRRQVPQ